MNKLVKVLAVATILTSGVSYNTTTQVTQENEASAKLNTYSNCREYVKKYPKGVRKSKSTKDRRENAKGVYYIKSNAKVSSKIYKTTMKKNKDLDRDRDGIACEK